MAHQKSRLLDMAYLQQDAYDAGEYLAQIEQLAKTLGHRVLPVAA